jgi:hypothetical protein
LNARDHIAERLVAASDIDSRRRAPKESERRCCTDRIHSFIATHRRCVARVIIIAKRDDEYRERARDDRTVTARGVTF